MQRFWYAEGFLSREDEGKTRLMCQMPDVFETRCVTRLSAKPLVDGRNVDAHEALEASANVGCEEDWRGCGWTALDRGPA